MIRKPNEDLFKNTTMTFGEHLEDLRGCLFRALFGIVIGFCLGLYFADSVILFIKQPLEKALGTYYSDIVIAKFALEVEKGNKLPYTVEQVTVLVKEKELLFDVHYINPTELVFALNAANPPENGDKPAVAPAPALLEPDKLVAILLWHRLDDDKRVRLIGLAIQDSFMIWVKAWLVVGLVISGPWIFWQIWTFVAAGLYPHERRYVHVFMPFSIGLFLLGASVAFLFVFEPVLNFLLSFYKSMDIDPDQRITDWLNFVLILPLGFGVSFQLPLVMLFLERIGVFDAKIYIEKWRIAILVIFVIAMILTPADPYSMLLMAVPLTFLYFGGVLLCKYLPKGRNPFDGE